MKNLAAVSLVFVLLLISCQDANTNKTEDEVYVIMLSLDGFRWDYTDKAHTPTFDSMQAAGVKAKSLMPSFPSKTFPNHYTIATGLYPDHHGIVLNSFYADDLDKEYSIFDKKSVSDDSFYGGEPIWITSEKNEVPSATLFWVGSEASTDGIMPSYWKTYQHNMPFYDRVDTLEKWLSYPEYKRPRLVCWYLHEPDSKGHHYGPNAQETIAQVESIDTLLGEFFTRMRKLPFYDKINFIITSDHGMSSTSSERQVILDQYIDTSLLLHYDGWNPNWNLEIKPGHIDEVYASLQDVEHIDVWKNQDIPKELNYGTNSRTHDITLVAKPEWSVYWSWNIGKGKGAHGYDNHTQDMHAIFYASGPAFKKGFSQPTFSNVNIYPLISEIMNYKPVATDGNLESVSGMLKNN